MKHLFFHFSLVIMIYSAGINCSMLKKYIHIKPWKMFLITYHYYDCPQLSAREEGGQSSLAKARLSQTKIFLNKYYYDIIFITNIFFYKTYDVTASIYLYMQIWILYIHTHIYIYICVTRCICVHIHGMPADLDSWCYLLWMFIVIRIQLCILIDYFLYIYCKVNYEFVDVSGIWICKLISMDVG